MSVQSRTRNYVFVVVLVNAEECGPREKDEMKIADIEGKKSVVRLVENVGVVLHKEGYCEEVYFNIHVIKLVDSLRMTFLKTVCVNERIASFSVTCY